MTRTLINTQRAIDNNGRALVNLITKTARHNKKKAFDLYINYLKTNERILKAVEDVLSKSEWRELCKYRMNAEKGAGKYFGFWDDEEETINTRKMPLMAILNVNLLLAVLVLTGVLFGAFISPQTVSASEKYNTYPVDDFHGYETPYGNTYAKLCVVVACQTNPKTYDTCVDFMDCMGNIYHMDSEKDGDIWIGDYYSCIMADMGTNIVADDRVIDIKYERVDLLMNRFQ